MAKSAVTPERFAKGMTFDEYMKYTGSPENLAREGFGSYYPDGGGKGAPRKDNSAVFRERYAKARLGDEQVAAIKWLAAQAGGLEMRIFNRDGKKVLGTRTPDPAAAPDANYDLMLEFLNEKNGAAWASLPVAVFYTNDFKELHRYHEYPAIYNKDRIRGHQQASRPGETADQARDRGMREFAALQAGPFFDLWASAAVGEILSGIHEKLVVVET